MIGRKLPAIEGTTFEHKSCHEVDHYILWSSHLGCPWSYRLGCGANAPEELLICYLYGVKWNVME